MEDNTSNNIVSCGGVLSDNFEQLSVKNSSRPSMVGLAGVAGLGEGRKLVLTCVGVNSLTQCMCKCSLLTILVKRKRASSHS